MFCLGNFSKQLKRNLRNKLAECFICGSKKGTQLHHLSYKPQLLIEVCKICHFKYGGGKKGTLGSWGEGSLEWWLEKIKNKINLKGSGWIQRGGE